MSHQTHHHKKKPEDPSEEQFTEAMNKALEEVPDKPASEETEPGKQRISSTGEEVEISKEDFRKLKLLS